LKRILVEPLIIDDAIEGSFIFYHIERGKVTLRNIEKLIKTGKDAMRRNPQLVLTKDEIKQVRDISESSALNFGLNLYAIGFTLGFILGKRHERGEIPK
jgi:hypothetical protein